MRVSLLLALFVAVSVQATENPARATADDQMVVSGKALAPQEVARAEPRATLAKEEFTAILSARQPACKNGHVGVAFEHGAFTSGAETFTFDALVKRAGELKKAGRISCLHVQSAHYDKKLYKSLEHALVDQQQISLFWNDTK